MGSNRQQFRLYLEKSGVIDALSRALMKLYDEPNKPENAVGYIRKYLCDEGPIEEQYETLKADHLETLKLVAELEEKLCRFKGNLKLTETEIAQTLDDGFKKLTENENCKSLLKKYLTKDLLTQLKTLKTSYDATILDCIQSGLDCLESDIGIYAADPECYLIFRDIFDPIISDYYEISDSIGEHIQKSLDWGDSTLIRNLDSDGQYIKSVRICISRNLEGYPFTRLLSEENFKEIEEKIKNTLLSLGDQFKGTYRTVKEIDTELYSQMIHKQLAFGKRNKILDNAGAYRFWPIGRGIFLTTDEDIVVWINAEDHMKIISIDKSGNLAEAYQRLVLFMETLNDSLKFVWNDRYGYLTFSPKNLGSTIEISARIQLSSLFEDQIRLNSVLDKLNLKIIKTSTKIKEKDNIFEIAMKRKLGPTEFESIKMFEESILELLSFEGNN